MEPHTELPLVAVADPYASATIAVALDVLRRLPGIRPDDEWQRNQELTLATAVALRRGVELRRAISSEQIAIARLVAGEPWMDHSIWWLRIAQLPGPVPLLGAILFLAEVVAARERGDEREWRRLCGQVECFALPVAEELVVPSVASRWLAARLSGEHDLARGPWSAPAEPRD